jgi:Ca-activated chloride channel family protein
MLITILMLFCFQLSFSVGALYGRRALSNDTTKPLWLKKYDATVTITDQISVTHVDQTFKNEDNFRKEGVFIFPLPENAVVTELALWINGQRVIGEVMEADTARAKYDSIVRRQIDPALLEDMGDNIFKLSVFPIERNGLAMSERRIEITYVELLPYDAGNVTYNFFMKTVNLSAKPLERASIAFNLSAQRKILSFTSPTHSTLQGLSIVKETDFKYTAAYGEEGAHSEKNLIMNYVLENQDYEINYLTYVPDPYSGMFFDEPGDHSYYLLWITPPDQLTQSQVLPKDVVMVADISSSMAGTRIVQLRNALNAMVDMLNPSDRFNIITFATGTTLFKSDLVQASALNISAAHTFINQLGEGGLTNMEDALKKGLSSSWNSASVNGLIFLTDGKPTWPVGSNSARILDTVEAYNPDEIAIHTFGIGEAVEMPFLKQLARENSGFSFNILKNDSISQILGNFMNKITYPLIRDISVSYGGLDCYDIFPRTLPNLYWGSQLTVLGRYRNTGTFPISFNGRVKTDTFNLLQYLAFPLAGQNHPFVPRMWASTKIDFLLDDITIYGEQQELVDEVKRLGKKFGIITPYTSMLVIEPGPGTGVVEDKTKGVPEEVVLAQNVPNPFNPTTTIRYSIPRQVRPVSVTVTIYNVHGKLVRILVNEVSTGGNFMVQWDGKDARGSHLSSGFYFAVLKAGNQQRMIKMHLLK